MPSGTRNGEIRIVGVTKRFGDMAAVRDLSLTIPDKAYCCLLGPSGCGKTTILRMIAGHETPTTGEIRIGGEPVVGLSPVQRGTAMMFQSYALFPHRSVLDNVAFSLKLRGASKADRHRQARELLTKVRMERFADRLPAQLSGGQQQRVAVARAVVARPKLILADEPTGNLDTANGEEVMQLLTQLNDDGTTIAMVTHSHSHAEYAHRIVNLLDGSVVTESIRQVL